ncbi:MAG: S26 family signal peptidase [Thermoplasmatota archaeon]
MAKLPAWIKDLLVLFVVFGVVIGGLFAYTQVWPPAVIVESGSMMHPDSQVTYGRVGTIDPGDMVLVKKVNVPGDVCTLAKNCGGTFGNQGDVVIYFPLNNRARTPIIHRALVWVTTNPDHSYDLDFADGLHHFDAASGITVAAWNLYNYKPCSSGFITKGDNPSTNPRPDQVSALYPQEPGCNGFPAPVQISWVEGKARGEIPWLGLIKLAIAPTPNENPAPASWTRVGNAYAPKDLWVMLVVSLVVLIGLPIVYDSYTAWKQRRRGRGAVSEEPPLPPPPTTGATMPPNDPPQPPNGP